MLLKKEREKYARMCIICQFNARSLQSRASIQHVTVMYGWVHTITIISHCASDATHTHTQTERDKQFDGYIEAEAQRLVLIGK